MSREGLRLVWAVDTGCVFRGKRVMLECGSPDAVPPVVNIEHVLLQTEYFRRWFEDAMKEDLCHVKS